MHVLEGSGMFWRSFMHLSHLSETLEILQPTRCDPVTFVQSGCINQAIWTVERFCRRTPPEVLKARCGCFFSMENGRVVVEVTVFLVEIKEFYSETRGMTHYCSCYFQDMSGFFFGE